MLRLITVTGIVAGLTVAATEDCKTKCTGFIDNELHLQAYDKFGFETSLNEPGGHMCVQMKGASSTTNIVLKRNPDTPTPTKVIEKQGCFYHKLTPDDGKLDQYDVGGKRFNFNFRLCTQDEIWDVAKCKVNDVCIKTKKSSSIICSSHQDSARLNKAEADLKPSFTIANDECNNKPQIKGREYTHACPPSPGTLSYCEYLLQNMLGLPSGKTPEQEKFWWARDLMKTSGTNCNRKEPPAEKDDVYIKTPTSFSTNVSDFGKGQKIKIEYALGSPSEYKFVLLDSSNKEYLTLPASPATTPPSEMEIKWKSTGPPKSGLYHGRFYTMAYDLRVLVDYIYFDPNHVAAKWSYDTSCTPGVTKFKCEGKLTQGNMGKGMRLEVSATVDGKTKVKPILSDAKTKAVEITPDNADQLNYTCTVKLKYRMNNGRIHEFVLGKHSDPQLLSCKLNQPPNANSTITPDTPDGTTVDPSNVNRNGNSESEDSKSNMVIIAVVVPIVAIIVIGIIIGLLVFFFVVKPRRDPAWKRVREAEDLKIAREEALEKLILRMKADPDYCMSPEAIQAYRPHLAAKNYTNPEFLMVGNVVKTMWENFFSDEILDVQKAAKIGANEWGYMMQRVRWPGEPLIKATAIPDINGNIPPLSFDKNRNFAFTPGPPTAIHASYITGIDNPKRYIGCQAPLNQEFDVSMRIWARENVKLVIAIGTDDEIIDADPKDVQGAKMSPYFRKADKDGTYAFGSMSMRLVKKLIGNSEVEFRKLEIYPTPSAEELAAQKAAFTKLTTPSTPSKEKVPKLKSAFAAPKAAKTTQSPKVSRRGSATSGGGQSQARSEAKSEAKSEVGGKTTQKRSASRSSNNMKSNMSAASEQGGSKARKPSTKSAMSKKRKSAGGSKADVAILMDPFTLDERKGAGEDGGSTRTVPLTGTTTPKTSTPKTIATTKADKSKRTSVKHVMYHLCYKNWADRRDLLAAAKHIVNIHQLMHGNRNLQGMLNEPNAKILVHCSAGRGRTGTLILAFNVLDLIERDVDPINLHILLEDLRACRFGMVQNNLQLATVVETVGELQDAKDKSIVDRLGGTE